MLHSTTANLRSPQAVYKRPSSAAYPRPVRLYARPICLYALVNLKMPNPNPCAIGSTIFKIAIMPSRALASRAPVGWSNPGSGSHRVFREIPSDCSDVRRADPTFVRTGFRRNPIKHTNNLTRALRAIPCEPAPVSSTFGKVPCMHGLSATNFTHSYWYKVISY